jgi:hypothetical protein
MIDRDGGTGGGMGQGGMPPRNKTGGQSIFCPPPSRIFKEITKIFLNFKPFFEEILWLTQIIRNNHEI